MHHWTQGLNTPSPGFEAQGSITDPAPTFSDSARPSFPRAGNEPPGKLAPLVQKYPWPRADAAAKMGSGAGATSLQKSVGGEAGSRGAEPHRFLK